MTPEISVLACGRRRRRWRWWDAAFLAAAAALIVFLVWSMIDPPWGVFDVRVSFGR